MDPSAFLIVIFTITAFRFIFINATPPIPDDIHSVTTYLLNNLTKHANVLIRPNVTGPVPVAVRIVINSLDPTDGKTYHVDAEGWIELKWYSPQLEWDPADYSGLVTVLMPSPLIWVPDLTYLNNADTTFTGEIKYVQVLADGTAIWRPKIHLSVRYAPVPPGALTASILNFGEFMYLQPIDGHRLTHTVKNGSWMYTTDSIIWIMEPGFVDTSMADPLSTYIIESSSILQQLIRQPHGIRSKVVVRLRITKNPFLLYDSPILSCTTCTVVSP